MHPFKSFLGQLYDTYPTLISAVYRGYSLIEASDDDDLLNELIAGGFTGQEFNSTNVDTVEPIRDGGLVTAMHGSLSRFDKFSYDHIGTNFSNTKDGFFFTNDMDYIDSMCRTLIQAKSGTAFVYTCKLTLGRTLTLKNYFETFDDKNKTSEMYSICNGDPVDIFDSYRDDIVSKAKENKCDSIHFRANHIDLYVVFDVNRIGIQDVKEFNPSRRSYPV